MKDMIKMAVHENYLKAGNPETPVAELRKLFSERDHKVRRRLAENPGTPDDLLSDLSADQNPEVRIAVAEHPQVRRTILEQLVADESVYVRFALAGQYSLPLDLLEYLANEDENPYVCDHASRTLEGLFLEKSLNEAGFVHVPGETEKLGELLVESGVLSADHVDELLKIAREREIPLGRAIVQTRALARSIVVAALKAQVKIRDGGFPREQAIAELKNLPGVRAV